MNPYQRSLKIPLTLLRKIQRLGTKLELHMTPNAQVRLLPPPEGLLNVSRKCKAGCQPKKSGGPSVNKRKRTTPAKWMPCTQPRTTYTIGDKITPGWGLTHRGDMDPAENWSVPHYSPPKFTEKQEAARQEAHRDNKKYKRYKPGQLALKEIRYYQKKAGFIIPISAIRRLCLEIGYECK